MKSQQCKQCGRRSITEYCTSGCAVAASLLRDLERDMWPESEHEAVRRFAKETEQRCLDATPAPPPGSDSRELARSVVVECTRGSVRNHDRVTLVATELLIDRIAALLDSHSAKQCNCEGMTDLQQAYGEHYDDCPMSTFKPVSADLTERVNAALDAWLTQQRLVLGRDDTISLRRAWATFAAGERQEERERAARVLDAAALKESISETEADGMDCPDSAEYHKGRRLILTEHAAAIRAGEQEEGDGKSEGD